MNDKLLTISEARQALAISRTTLYSLLKRGEIRAVKLGRATRVPESEVSRIIAAAPSWESAA